MLYFPSLYCVPVNSNYSRILISRTLGFSNLPITRASCRFPWICFTLTVYFTPDFSNPRLFETDTPTIPWEKISGKITLHNSNPLEIFKPTSADSSYSSDFKQITLPEKLYFSLFCIFTTCSKRQICHLPSVTTKMCMIDPYKTVPQQFRVI